MRRAAVILVCAIGLAACGDGDGGTPDACLAGAGAYLKALDSAPGTVKLAGSTPIGSCLVDEQGGGEIATVGRAMVRAAATLNAHGRRDPAGEAPLELGYLVGAAERAASGTGGIHQDLIRRLESAARFSPGGRPLPPAFQSGFGQGYAAGQRGG